jgi:hypothetical protein
LTWYIHSRNPINYLLTCQHTVDRSGAREVKEGRVKASDYPK